MKFKHKIRYVILIVVVVTIGLKSMLESPQTDIKIYDRFWTLKTFDDEEYDVVVGGDSRVYRGVSPATMENILDMDVVNLGYSSGGLSEQLLDFYISRLREDGNRILLLGITPYSLTKEALENEQYNELLEKSDFEQFKNIKINPLLTFFSAYKVKDIFLGWESGGDIYYQVYMDNGWVKSDRNVDKTEESLKSYRSSFEGNTVDENDLELFFKNVKRAIENGIHVYGFFPPTDMRMLALEDSLSNLDRQKFISEFRNVGAHWIEVDPAEFETYDGSHLKYRSAEKLSGFLAEEISKFENTK